MSTKKRVNALEYPSEVVNSYFKGGKLTPEYSAVSIEGTYPANVLFAKYSHMVERYFACSSYAITMSSDGVNFHNYSVSGNNSPFLIEEYLDETKRAAIIAGKHVMMYSNSSISLKELKYRFDCGVIHCGRLFGVDGYTLRWSGAESYEAWDEGLHGSGYLTLDPERGKVLNMLVYGGKLIAVREYGLTVFGMYGVPEDFSVSFTNTDCDRIYKNTACIVGGKIYFCSQSGLKSFDGSKISPLELKHAVSAPKSAVEYGGKYFLACKSEQLGRNVILCLDSDGGCCIIDASANVLYVKDGVRFFNSGGQGILEKGGRFYFESSALDFGTDRFKTVTQIKVTGKARICITSGEYSRYFDAENETVYPHMRGRRFIVTAEGEGEVSEISVTAEVMDAV